MVKWLFAKIFYIASQNAEKVSREKPYQCQLGAFAKYVTEVNLFVEVLAFIENVKVSE